MASVARVSVLIPVRNAAATLGEALASLREQSLEDHEVIAIDDGSSDGSDEILAAAALQDSRLRVERSRGRGLVAALNQALALARAPFVARMDADDVAHAQRLARQAGRLASDPTTDVLGCRVRCFGRGPGAGMQAYVAWQNDLLDHDAIVRDLFVESPLAHPSVMMRRAALVALGGYRAFDGPEDYDLWLRAHAAGLRFAKCAQVLLDWRDSGARLTRTDPRYAAGRFRDLKVSALGRGLLARSRAAVVWGAGPVGKAFALALLAAGHAVAAFVEVDPRKLGHRVHGAPVVPLEEAVARFRSALHLGAVGQPGARVQLRAEAARVALVEGRDFIAVA
jgi:glycosyltransferase involved in cell wall biosynthesis